MTMMNRRIYTLACILGIFSVSESAGWVGTSSSTTSSWHSSSKNNNNNNKHNVLQRVAFQQQQHQHSSCLLESTTGLKYKSSSDTDEWSSSSFSSAPTIQRLSIQGVSVSPDGFWLMLQVPTLSSQSDKDKQGEENHDQYLPLQTTANIQDAYAATSAESLTLIQLLSGVDMAGAILPPDILSQMVVLYCEDEDEDDDDDEVEENDEDDDILELKQMVRDFIQENIPETSSAESYTEAHTWTRSKIRLPMVTLNELKMDLSTQKFTLSCSIKGLGEGGRYSKSHSISFQPSESILQEVCYNYCPKTSISFLCTALALRYRTPIELQYNNNNNSSNKKKEEIDDQQQNQQQQQQNKFLSEQQIKSRFPMYATTSSLRQTSNRVHENIERGFEIHKLSGALRIAMERGDTQAAEKIRAKLDEYDSFDNLPTTTTTTTSDLESQSNQNDVVDVDDNNWEEESFQ